MRNGRPITTARFWTYANMGLVKLSIPIDKPMRWAKKERDTEGWSVEAHGWTFDGNFLREEVCSDGVDCDGRYKDGFCLVCPTDEISHGAVNGDGIFPKWELADEYHRDYAAEAMGY